MDFAVRFRDAYHHRREPVTGRLTVAQDTVTLEWREPLVPGWIVAYISACGMILIFDAFPIALIFQTFFWQFEAFDAARGFTVSGLFSLPILLLICVLPLRRKTRIIPRAEITDLIVEKGYITCSAEGREYLFVLNATDDTQAAATALREGCAVPQTWKYTDTPRVARDRSTIERSQVVDVTIDAGVLTVAGLVIEERWHQWLLLLNVYSFLALFYPFLLLSNIANLWINTGIPLCAMALLAISFRWLQRVKCETICWQLGEITEIEAKERHVVFRVPDGKGKTRRFVWLLPTQEETDAVAARLRGEIHERWAATLASTRSRSQFRLRPPLTDVLTVPRRISVEDEQVTITGRTGLRHPHAGWWALGISAAGFVILRVILEARFAALGLGAPEFPALAVVSAAMLAIGLIFLPTALLINLWYARGIRLPRKAISVTVQEDRRLVFEIHGKWRIELLAASEADARALCAAFTPPSASPDASPHPTLTPPR